MFSYLLRLSNSARESIQQETVLALGLIQVAVDHVHYKVIGHQLSSVHHLFQFGADL